MKHEPGELRSPLNQLEPVGGGGTVDFLSHVTRSERRAALEGSAVVKALCDTFADNLRAVGLKLHTVNVFWNKALIAGRVHDELRRKGLISDERSLTDSLGE